MKEYNFYVAMVVIQLANGVTNILIKISLDKGFSQLAFVVYRHLIAMLLLGPFAYVLERNQRPSLSFSIITKIFVLSSLGTTIHLNVYYAGLAYTSPTVACALSNVSPCLTFLIALLLRMEKLKIASMRSKAKVLGTVICVCGSLVFTIWKGHLLKGFVEKPLIDIKAGSVGEFKHTKQNWIKGVALILISYIALSGCLMGAFVIIVGLYLVLWGKRADSNQIRKHQCDDSKVPEISTKDVPMLNPVREEA
ncbi:hypothetical protein FEM48_Zijuj03G0034000 [Ziziphus jujuba var. spinosa]|uniref:WAT1-related protein n=1 Tax=Ziziphus jujuba var. spinosa TaxID=714518 RepID=A0A978VMW5_ZIZJJ|nr:hypothetical protein FEM48_Zijuj03G0034000 [Ziziphus jujuba var. spinosa]